jgi:hypothetical protein
MMLVQCTDSRAWRVGLSTKDDLLFALVRPEEEFGTIILDPTSWGRIASPESNSCFCKATKSGSFACHSAMGL